MALMSLKSDGASWQCKVKTSHFLKTSHGQLSGEIATVITVSLFSSLSANHKQLLVSLKVEIPQNPPLLFTMGVPIWDLGDKIHFQLSTIPATRLYLSVNTIPACNLQPLSLC